MATWYIATNGSSSNNGQSQGAPWSLTYGLSTAAAALVHGGDTVYLMDGTYTIQSYSSGYHPTNCYLQGTTNNPVILKPLNRRGVVFQDTGNNGAGSNLTKDGYSGAFNINAPWIQIQGIRWKCTQTANQNDANESRPHAIASNTNNFIICHNTFEDFGIVSKAFANGPNSDNVLVHYYGNVEWNCGRTNNEHGVYMHNAKGGYNKSEMNILFNTGAYGIHAYGEAPGQLLDNVWAVGNLVFNTGANHRGGSGATNPIPQDGSTANAMKPGIRIGGGVNTATIHTNDPVLRRNWVWYPTSMPNRDAGDCQTRLGGNGTNLVNPTADSNFLTGPTYALALYGTLQGTFTNTNNIFAGAVSGFSSGSGTGNTYLGAGGRLQLPAGTLKYQVESSIYEAGRGHIYVYNPNNLSQIVLTATDLSFLPSGTTYAIYNCQRMYDAPVVTGTYSGGTITIPLAQVTPYPVLTNTNSTVKSGDTISNGASLPGLTLMTTGNELHGFVLEPTGTAATNQTITVTSGIASSETFGTSNIVRFGAIAPIGLSSAEAFGTATIATTRTLLPTGIPSAEAFGTTALVTLGAITPFGIPSEEAFGTVTLVLRPTTRQASTGRITAPRTAHSGRTASSGRHSTTSQLPD